MSVPLDASAWYCTLIIELLGPNTNSPPDEEIVIIDESEEDTLRKIFESEAPPKQPPPQQRSIPPATSQQPPQYIELKLGKRLTIQPDEERSLSIALRQRISPAERKKFHLSRHFDFFARFQDSVAMTLELINGSTVQVDLRNVGETPVTVEADQHVVLLEERRPRPLKMKKQRPKVPPPSSPNTVRKSNSSSSLGAVAASLEGRISPKQDRKAVVVGGSGGSSGPTLKYDIRDDSPSYGDDREL